MYACKLKRITFEKRHIITWNGDPELREGCTKRNGHSYTRLVRVDVICHPHRLIHNIAFDLNGVNWMDPADYITDLEEEARTLRGRVTELEQELRKVSEELRVARERKVEEVTVPSYFHSPGIDGD